MDEDTRKQVEDLIAQFKKKGNDVHFGMEKAVAKACMVVERKAKKSMRDTIIDIDTVYKRRSIEHSPSVEGNPPAIDTGRLVQSITHRIESAGHRGNVDGYVGTAVIYGRMLEYGTTKMSPRPWLYPALDACREKIRKAMGDAVEGADISIEGDEE
jgi:HK97 gp10 family phage protein